MGSPPEPEIIYFMDEIIKTLRRDDDLVAVLRGQLHIEALLSKVLLTKYPGAIELLDHVGYFDKIRLARKANLINAEMRRALHALGELRNSFAHLPVKHMITKEDEETFLAEMPETVREGRKDVCSARRWVRRNPDRDRATDAHRHRHDLSVHRGRKPGLPGRALDIDMLRPRIRMERLSPQ
jgi:hypothetical protein